MPRAPIWLRKWPASVSSTSRAAISLPCQRLRAVWQAILAGLALERRPSLVARRERAGSGGSWTSSARPGC
jgi:hypothetical protein